MGFFRGALLLLVGSLLVVSFFAGNLLWTLSLSLQYENVGPGMVSSVTDLVGGEEELTDQIEQGLEELENHCQTTMSDYVIYYEGQIFNISCDMVNKSVDEALSEGVENLVSDTYYQEYDCKFWSCFEETGSPQFLVSEKARVYWQQKFYLALLVSVVLVIVSFFLVEHKANWPIVVGSLLVISALPFMKLEPFVSSFLQDTYLQFLGIFISKSSAVFWQALIIGIIILAIGVLLHFLNLGNFLANKFKVLKAKTKQEKPKTEVAKTEEKPLKKEAKK